MKVRPDRICIFCGLKPQGKNLEHPLPQWLLRMTGDPNRVVKLGLNWRTGQVFEFAYDQLRFPACSACNTQYAALEDKARVVVETICRKEAATPGDYVLLLDWLDKVRVGLWLGYKYLVRNPIPPNFAINTRLAKKDRMVAVYAFTRDKPGLSTWGAETPLFQYKPCAFSLGINDIILLNASWDWMCASRTGFPFPRRFELLLDDASGATAVGEFRTRRKITHPVMPLLKSCVTLFQPIVQTAADGTYPLIPEQDVAWCSKMFWPDHPNAGPLYRQLPGQTVEISPTDDPISFDTVTDREANTSRNIANQAYKLQIDSVQRDQYVSADPAKLNSMKKLVKNYTRYNRTILGLHAREARANIEQKARK